MKNDYTMEIPSGFLKPLKFGGPNVGTLGQLKNELHRACFKGEADTVREILAAGSAAGNRFRVNAVECDAPPLVHAVRQRADDAEAETNIANIARMLIHAGANVDAIEGGESPLILASIAAGGKVGKAQTVRLLCESGANLRCRDNTQKMTPLHWACVCGFKDVVEVLLEAGASASSITGKSAGPNNKVTAAQIVQNMLHKLAKGELVTPPQPKTEEAKEALREELTRTLHMLEAASLKREAEKREKKEARRNGGDSARGGGDSD